MPVSDAKKRANRKYSDAHYEPLRLDVPKGYKAQIQAAATAAGQSVAAYVREAIARRMEHDAQVPKEYTSLKCSCAPPPNPLCDCVRKGKLECRRCFSAAGRTEPLRAARHMLLVYWIAGGNDDDGAECAAGFRPCVDVLS